MNCIRLLNPMLIGFILSFAIQPAWPQTVAITGNLAAAELFEPGVIETVREKARLKENDPDVRLARYLDRYARAMDLNGVLLVAQGGKILHHRAYDLSSREWSVPHTCDSLFQLASISKPMTALVVMRLVEKGILRLDDTLSRHLPDFPSEKGERITLRQLLTHTGGFGHWGDAPEFELWK